MTDQFVAAFKRPGAPGSRGKYLSRVFGIFSEEIVRIWAADPRAPFEDLGRPTLRVDGEDGTSLALRVKAFGPTKSLRASTTTLQANDGTTRVRFRATFKADVSPGSMSLTRFDTRHPAFMGLAGARRAPGPAVAQRHFESTMEEPVLLSRV